MPAGLLRVKVGGPEAAMQRQFNELFPGRTMQIVERAGEMITWSIDAGPSSGPIEESIARLVVKNNWSLYELSRERATLEDVFRSLTMPKAAEVAHA
jgi:hypothetical protein